MPNSATQSPSEGLFIPGMTDTQVDRVGESPLQEYLETAVRGVEDYARREPWTFAACVLGVGFVLGWKLKFW